MPADLLWRRPRRHDRDPHRQPARHRSVGMVVPLLSGLASARAPERHRRHLRPGPRRLRGRVARVPVEPDGSDFQAWRDERDSTARKYALWDAGNRVPANEWELVKPCYIFSMHMRRYLQLP